MRAHELREVWPEVTTAPPPTPPGGVLNTTAGNDTLEGTTDGYTTPGMTQGSTETYWWMGLPADTTTHSAVTTEEELWWMKGFADPTTSSEMTTDGAPDGTTPAWDALVSSRNTQACTKFVELSWPAFTTPSETQADSGQTGLKLARLEFLFKPRDINPHLTIFGDLLRLTHKWEELCASPDAHSFDNTHTFRHFMRSS